MTQKVLLCEGFDDRAFWSGLLLHLGCTDPTFGGQQKQPDAYGRAVDKPRFLLHDPLGNSILLVPVQGKSRLARFLGNFLTDHITYPIHKILLNRDSDAINDSDTAVRDALRTIAQRHSATLEDPDKDRYTVDGCEIGAVVWKCTDPPGTPGIPNQQTLERLVSAAIAATEEGRAGAVERWLQDEPRGDLGPKNYSYSYLAKWFANRGSDDFFRALWRGEAIAQELRQRLEATGAWDMIEWFLD